ncbi:jg6364 [Pararge aegeria aegeria]|uniref:Jg6364 protein n=1 Tax=Pararge aegeria aegeria TaxID=348720 RepID=A0A8S4RPP4_9NEOP|nr:jg6364 [Pararge aegeria aegeria]
MVSGKPSPATAATLLMPYKEQAIKSAVSTNLMCTLKVREYPNRKWSDSRRGSAASGVEFATTHAGRLESRLETRERDFKSRISSFPPPADKARAALYARHARTLILKETKSR